MNQQCIFCRIIAGEVPAEIVGQSDGAIAIRDRNPQAPSHILVIPRRHAATLAEYVGQAKPEEVGSAFSMASKLGRDANPAGYRVVVNEGRDGGQTVDHVHIHVLAGRPMHWPPG
ncbi:MAG: HIT domain-containing protein [Candidatus Eremiobacteraeota bacterium]|nr:HIT domain-containing protein [Candidatus Eremiobacteraeota bacterium]